MTTLVADKVAEAGDRIDHLALWALHTEVSLYPKAGLVSLVDTGSHDDMDAATFFASLTALKGYFRDMAIAGARDADFRELNSIGREAEARMFAATRGVNTHRGAIFSLGLLAAAAGLNAVHGKATAPMICRTVADRWGRAILANRPARDTSHGAEVRARYGAPGAREEAASGFPTLLLHTIPAFDEAFAASGSVATSALQAFYASMAILEDNNLLYRGGPDGLEEAQMLADAFIKHGGMLAPSGRERAIEMHRRFVARRFSPGGSADLLIATLFLVALDRRISSAWA
jgi:triphosphoribosyl-dephospho-CoA synthase